MCEYITNVMFQALKADIKEYKKPLGGDLQTSNTKAYKKYREAQSKKTKKVI